MLRRPGRNLLSLALLLSLAGTVACVKKESGGVTLPVSSASGGNGDPYDGGDLAKRNMTAALEQTRAALKLIASGYDVASLCDPNRCSRDKAESACNLIDQANGTSGALNYLRSFLTDADVVAQLLDKATKTSIEIQEAVTVNGVAKSAKTDPSTDGPIYVARLDALAMSVAQRIGILTHETGHKITFPRPGGKIGDEISPNPAFTRGDQFLDSAGACVAAYAVAHPSAPGAPDLDFSGGLVATAATKTYPEIVLADEPHVYFRMDEGTGTVAKDSSPGGFDGTYFGGVTLGATGGLPAFPNSTAVRFNGTNSYMEIPDAAYRQAQPVGSIVTVEMWCYISATDIQNNQYSCSVQTHDNSGGQRGYALFFWQNRFYFQIGDGQAWANSNVSVSRTTAGWYHVVGTHDSFSHALYLNGQLVASQPNAPQYAPSGKPLWIGRNPDLPTEYHTGIVDEVAIYDHLLNPVQIKEHYDAGAASVVANLGATSHRQMADGRIVTASVLSTSVSNQILINRYNADGTPDLTLNGTGRLLTAARTTASVAIAPVFAIAGDGTIFVAAPGVSGRSFPLYRYEASGKGDPQQYAVSGPNGLQLSVTDFPSAVIAQPDGKVVVAGTARQGTRTVGRLLRYLPRGFDTGFGANGVVSLSLTANNEGFNAATLAGDGKLYATGVTDATSTASRLLVARFRANGALDGTVTTDWNAKFNIGRAIALDPNGKIVVAGEASDDGPKRVGLVRMDDAGNADFKMSTAAGESATPSALVLADDGKIVVGGTVFAQNKPGPLLLRFTRAGALDPTFNGDGTLRAEDLITYLPDPKYDTWMADALSMTAQGKLLVTGHATKTGRPNSGFLIRLWY